MKKKILCVVLALVLCAGICSVGISAKIDISSWDILQAAINMSTGDPIPLISNVVAEDGDSALVIPEDRVVVIDLNGFKIDRGLADSDPVADGCVFCVKGELTIKDSIGGGKITGGNNIGSAGGVLINKTGTFTLENGSICNNKTQDGGGGVFARGVFNMLGGSVTKNYAKLNAGGVYIYGTDSVRLPANSTEFITSTISGGEITYNSSDRSGGGMFVDYYDMLVKIDNCVITNNTAKLLGGGISSNRALTLGNNTVIKNNYATVFFASDVIAPNRIMSGSLSEKFTNVVNTILNVFSALLKL